MAEISSLPASQTDCPLCLYSLRGFEFAAQISVDLGTFSNARKTNEEPLSMPGWVSAEALFCVFSLNFTAKSFANP